MFGDNLYKIILSVSQFARLCGLPQVLFGKNSFWFQEAILMSVFVILIVNF
jgi:hypothetical protein